MNENSGWNARGSICEGCLSVDRNLSLISDEDSQKMFCGFLYATEHSTHAPLLCWECAAVLKKVIQFKLQVQRAHDNLVKYLLNQTHLKPLSNLSITTTPAPSHLQHVPDTEVLIIPAGTEREQLYMAETEPLTFIKVEDELFDSFGDDGACDDEQGDGEEKTHVTAGNEELVATGTDSKETFKPSASDGLEFDESDDEPLTMKRAAEKKPRGRRKKKEENGGADPPKRGKREQPAGVVASERVLNKLRQLNADSTHLEMVLLSWSEVEAERQRALASDAFTRHEYRCHNCALGFNHSCKLRDHMRKHDPASGTAECGVCRVRCKDSHALAAHKRRHRVRWRCRICGGTWSRAAVAADHAAREHGAPAPAHRCSVCGHRAPTLGKLRNHIKNHSERQKCELCGKTFRDRTSLRTHLFIHRGEKEYACGRCGARFLFKRALQLHQVTHDAHAHLYCHSCDMNFKNSMSYNQHMKYNLKHIDPAKLKYACQLCDKKFVKAVRLEEHNLAVHLKLTPIQCSVPGCNFACASRPALRAHRRRHRGGRARRDHVCHVCGNAYTTKKSLEGHLRSHSGERPFRCARCAAAFAHRAALHNHARRLHPALPAHPAHPEQVPRSRAPAEPPAAVAPPAWPRALPHID